MIRLEGADSDVVLSQSAGRVRTDGEFVIIFKAGTAEEALLCRSAEKRDNMERALSRMRYCSGDGDSPTIPTPSDCSCGETPVKNGGTREQDDSDSQNLEGGCASEEQPGQQGPVSIRLGQRYQENCCAGSTLPNHGPFSPQELLANKVHARSQAHPVPVVLLRVEKGSCSPLEHCFSLPPNFVQLQQAALQLAGSELKVDLEPVFEHADEAGDIITIASDLDLADAVAIAAATRAELVLSAVWRLQGVVGNRMGLTNGEVASSGGLPVTSPVDQAQINLGQSTGIEGFAATVESSASGEAVELACCDIQNAPTILADTDPAPISLLAVLEPVTCTKESLSLVTPSVVSRPIIAEKQGNFSLDTHLDPTLCYGNAMQGPSLASALLLSLPQKCSRDAVDDKPAGCPATEAGLRSDTMIKAGLPAEGATTGYLEFATPPVIPDMQHESSSAESNAKPYESVMQAVGSSSVAGSARCETVMGNATCGPGVGWSVEGVCALFAQCGFDQYGSLLREMGVDGKTLLLLTDEDFLLNAREGGLGMPRLQLRRLRAELAARGVAGR